MMKWYTYLHEITKQVAKKSKDPSRQVGCVIVGPDYEIRSTGFNGFPRGVAEEISMTPQAHYVEKKEYDLIFRDIRARCTCGEIIRVPHDEWDKGNLPEHFSGAPRPEDYITALNERWQRPQKYEWVEHAERNAIYNAARMGIPLKGCVAYVTLAPCVGCTRAIIQAGIVEVYGPAFPKKELPIDYHFDIAQQMMHEAGVSYRVIDDAPEDNT